MPFDSILCAISKQSLAGCNRRRSRTLYTQEQLNAMEFMFSTNQYPGINSREELADAIGLSEARVQVGYFQVAF